MSFNHKRPEEISLAIEGIKKVNLRRLEEVLKRSEEGLRA